MVVGRENTSRWWTLGAFCLVLYVSVSFKSMVGIAIPDLQADLDASLAQLQWVLNAYTLMLAAFLLSGGAIADRYGRRRVYLIGLAVFAAGAVACVASPSATVLDFSSALMGVGGAIIFSAGAALVSQRFTGRDRAAAFGAVAAASAAASAAGPIVAGVLIDGVGWRGVFAFLAVLSLPALAVELARGTSEADVRASDRPLDWLGPITFAGAVFLLVFVLIRGNEEGFGSPLIVTATATAAVLLAAFAVTQAVRGRPGSRREPMLDLAVLRRPSVAGAAVGSFVLGFVAFGLTFYAAIYIGRVLGNSPTDTGLKFLPLTATAFVVAPLGGWLMRRAPTRALLAACLGLMALGSLLLRAVDAGTGWTSLVAGFAVIGLGSGLIVPALVSTSVSVVPPERTGVAAAIGNTARQLGIAFGVAGLGSFFQARVAARLESAGGAEADALAEGIVAGALAAPGAPPDAAVAFFGALDEVFLVLAVVAALGAVLTAALVRPRDFVIPPGGHAAPPAAPAGGLARTG